MNPVGKMLAFLALVALPLLLRAGGDEVVVIYNKNVPESKTVAEYYAKARAVPKGQIYGFALSPNEEISRDEFQNSFQLPLARKLEHDGLWKFAKVKIPATNNLPEHVEQCVVASKIRYAVLCYGIPLKIASDPTLHEYVNTNTRPELLRNEAAVDSELAWLPLIKTDFQLSGPMQNRIYGATNVNLLNPTNGILLVARLDGPTPEIARGLVDKALDAETNGLWGRAYFDIRGLPKTDSYFLGDEWILGAAQIAKEFGYETTIDDKPETFPIDFPMSQIAIYCGWYDGTVSGPFTLPKVEFMPGAFAYHLHSFSAATVRNTTQNWVGPLLAKGATCTMGCVYEPYLMATPNVAAFLQRFASGFTFGEAAWAAQPVLSWQTTVVGDPLYRPFSRPLSEWQTELTNRHSPLIEWMQLCAANRALAQGVFPARVINYLENVNATLDSAVLTEKLAALCDEQGKPSSAITYYQRALQFKPSPEQRIRLRLTLGEKLLAQNRKTDAIDDYKQLLAEAPDYPGKNKIQEKLDALDPNRRTPTPPQNRN
ncbi:MAG TPA: TIGR03790 family protein [Verrucomicrobiae bacterium]|nr:TIGR03790 family protein [Verrucomicrobiae bacterium]